MPPNPDMLDLDDARDLMVMRHQAIRHDFYAVFHALTDQAGLPKPGTLGSRSILRRGEQLAADILLPPLNKKDSIPEDQVAAIPASALVLAVYAAAAQQNTRWLGRAARALRTFDHLHHTPFENPGMSRLGVPERGAIGLLDHPATAQWLKDVRASLTARLHLMNLDRS